MGFLDRAIKRGISEGIGRAVGEAVEKAVAPKAEQVVGNAARQIDQAAGSTAQQVQNSQNSANQANQANVNQAANSLGGLFSSLESAANNFANEAAKNMKICPSCGEAAGKDQKFCPSCGAKLPEVTIAEGAVCPSCGKQNSGGMKFCSDCGTKLPAAIAEEEAAAANDEAVLAKWDEVLPNYPKWTLGGKDFSIETYGDGVMFSAKMQSSFAAQGAVEQYRAILRQSGFQQAGQYPFMTHLYKMINGVCYHVDTEHCFDSANDCPCINFDIGEPVGGFNYVKPEPKKQMSFKDLLRL